MTIRIPTSGALLGAVAVLAILPVTARAQALDARWLPWLGCWQPAVEEAVGSDDRLVCVRAATGEGGVEIVAVSAGAIVSSRTLLADGQPHDLTDGECSGWQSARFSGDGSRVFLRSDLTCEGGAKRTASAIMAMAPPAEWLDAQSVGLDNERMPRASRYRLGPESVWPEEFALPADRAARAADARLVASAELSIRDLEEATARVDREAVVAFLVERNQEFDLDASTVAALSDAGMPDEVIDMLVAVSYPARFAIERQTMRTALVPAEAGERDQRGSGDPYGWGWSGRGGYPYGACFGGLWSWYCDPFGYSPYGYGYYGSGWYGGSYGYGYWGQPVIVVRESDAPSGAAGRAVRGRGYTRGGQPGGSTAGRNAEPRGSGGTAASVGSGGGSRGGGGASGSGSSGGTRTAKPRGGP